jgi:hypothetical protein
VGVEGPPLSYGCVVERLYLFRGEKSRKRTVSILFLKKETIPGGVMVQLNGDIGKNSQKHQDFLF